MQIVRLTALALALCAAPALAAEPKNGEALYTANCVACHAKLMNGNATAIFTRPDHKVTSFDGLKTQVRRCDTNLGLRWFDDEIDSVSKYLNKTYYHFKE